MKLAIVGYQCLSSLHSPLGPPNFRSILHSITASLRSAFSAGLSKKLKFETLDCKLLFSLFLKNAFVEFKWIKFKFKFNALLEFKTPSELFSLAHHTWLQLELCRFLVSFINSASWLLVFLFIFVYFLSLPTCLIKIQVRPECQRMLLIASVNRDKTFFKKGICVGIWFFDAPMHLIFWHGFRNLIFVICGNGDSWTHCAFRNPASNGSELYGSLIGNVKKSFLGTITKSYLKSCGQTVSMTTWCHRNWLGFEKYLNQPFILNLVSSVMIANRICSWKHWIPTLIWHIYFSSII